MQADHIGRVSVTTGAERAFLPVPRQLPRLIPHFTGRVAATTSGHAERCLALLRQLGDLEFESHALHAMARARQVAGAHAEAVALGERAIEVESVRESPWNHALLLETLGESLWCTGDDERALQGWREALAIFDAHGEHRVRDLRKRLAALVSASSG